MNYQIEFEPVGRRGRCAEGKLLLDCARQLGVGLVSICGGNGKCLACKVQILKGAVSETTSIEREAFPAQELADGWRLACLTYPQSDCTLHMPPESMTTVQRMQVEGQEVPVVPEPVVKAYRVKLMEPTLFDLRSDATRLMEKLAEEKVNINSIDIDVQRGISPQLRSWKWQACAAVRRGEVVALGPRGSRLLGLAVDLGSTKIAGYLVDLESGRTLATKGVMNPQISYGEDITSRIGNAMKSAEEAARLQRLAVSAIDRLAVDLCAQAGVGAGQIVDAVVVGNTAMHHLFLGLPVRQLAYSPFVAAVQEAIDVKARDVGLHLAAGACVHLLPNIAGFVGADHVSMLVAIGAARLKGVVVALDIGTNTEVSLINHGRITSVSCASGPAFEGGHIKHGMRAASGAIERLRIADAEIEYQTIDNAPPAGICGSGVIDAMGQLYLAGVLDEGGRMKSGSHPNLHTRGSQREFVIAGEQDGRPAITLTQHDIRELQLAKAAIRTGIQVLLESGGRTEEEIDRVIIAGAFGTYVDVGSAIAIGMLPALPLGRFRQVGNAAGLGARMALLSKRKRTQAQALASKVSYIELAAAPNFNQTFIQASYLGPYRINHGKREGID